MDEKNHLQLVGGVRFDKHSSLGNWIVSPRINIRYQIFDAISIRGGITTGFKAPQLFDEDLHICGLEGTQRVIRNRSGLEEEKSFSYTAGFEFQDFIGEVPMLIGITGFYTVLRNAYVDEFIRIDGPVEYWERINSSGADVKGVEIDFGVKPESNFEIRTGFTFKKNKYKDILSDFNTRNFLRTPDIFGYLRTSYQILPELTGFISMKYSGSMYVPHEIPDETSDEPILLLTESPSFTEFDLALTYKMNLFGNVNNVLTLGIKNLTDTFQKDLDFGVSRDPAYVYGPIQPRTIYFSADLSL